MLFFMGATAIIAVWFAADRGHAQDLKDQPMATAERVRSPGWWPTKSSPRLDEYVRPAVCAQCHSAEAAIQETTSMAKACGRAADSKILQAHPHQTFLLGGYAYDLALSEGKSTLSVSDGTHSISAALGWAFGEGVVGETFVFAHGGNFYEARLSYFPALQALDITPGQSTSAPADFDGALGRRMEPEETHLCFGCHNTAASAGGKFDPDHLTPGVTCEACHGPGSRHVSAMKTGRIAEGLTDVLNPAKLAPVESVDFCGACHRAWADVMESGMQGVATLRFQPYRLELSRCWGKGDARITCLACHDPHQPLVRDQRSYDNRCLRCHLSSTNEKGPTGHRASACPHGTKDCTTCHMPKYEVPGTHAKFTDHRIRIVRSDKQYAE
jgi:hypothetical protein